MAQLQEIILKTTRIYSFMDWVISVPRLQMYRESQVMPELPRHEANMALVQGDGRNMLGDRTNRKERVKETPDQFKRRRQELQQKERDERTSPLQVTEHRQKIIKNGHDNAAASFAMTHPIEECSQDL